MMDTLAEGRFAVIRKAQLNSAKDRSVVAAKALRSKLYHFMRRLQPGQLCFTTIRTCKRRISFFLIPVTYVIIQVVINPIRTLHFSGVYG